MTEQVSFRPVEDRTMPAVVYALYLLGLANGLTIIVGLVLAYANQATAGPHMRSHLTFMIRTFWLSIAWWIIGGVLVLIGFPTSFILIGMPILALGWLILAAIGIWFVVRCVVGLLYLVRNEPYPRPYAWLL